MTSLACIYGRQWHQQWTRSPISTTCLILFGQVVLKAVLPGWDYLEESWKVTVVSSQALPMLWLMVVVYKPRSFSHLIQFRNACRLKVNFVLGNERVSLKTLMDFVLSTRLSWLMFLRYVPLIKGLRSNELVVIALFRQACDRRHGVTDVVTSYGESTNSVLYAQVSFCLLLHLSKSIC